MTALEAVVQRGPVAAGGTVHYLPSPVEVGRPGRVNLAGFCIMCFDHACTSQVCIEHWEVSVWVICRHCDGSGRNHATGAVCNCESGLVDLTHSEWINTPSPRPPRLNLAGWCLWCSNQWCTNPRCIEHHPRSRWEVCDRCDGRAFDEITATACGCISGLIEMAPAR